VQSEEKDDIQYFTLFKKGLKKPSKYHECPKKDSKNKNKVKEKPIRTWRKENIHLETVLGKLLTSYAGMQPKKFDIESKISL